MSTVHSVVVNRAAADSARHGHPWIWRRAVVRGLDKSATGSEVQIVAEDGTPIGRGAVDRDSPIAVRVWTRDVEPLGDKLIRARIDRAVAIRAAMFSDDATNAYRVVNGEGDRMPGFVVDRYADVAVLRLDGDAAEAQAEWIAPLFEDALKKIGVRIFVKRSSEKGATRAREVIFGDGSESAPDTIHVREHGVPFVVDLAKGQKTGAFLDQRENRRRVGELSANKRVLNLFSYAGGFSLHAALVGARVTSVDVAAAAHATAQASFRLAKVDPRGHEFVSADAFAFLGDAKSKGRSWEVIVCDPPSFAPNEKAKARAMTAYRSLHRACADVLAPGGTFCPASCSSHIDAIDFASTLDDAALGRNDLRILEMHGPPADHPSLPAWPEGRYLKFAVLA
jgi:23S rRNA (cytosine1962-C5)-methyltransferase